MQWGFEMVQIALTFFTGLIFGLGLAVSQMINPAKVQGFLDLFGDWDPSLAFVMGGGLVVTFFGYRFVLQREQPLLAGKFELPTKHDLDIRLLAGAATFGVGWGLIGFCPGPALSALSSGRLDVLIFVVAMAAGMFGVGVIDSPKLKQA